MTYINNPGARLLRWRLRLQDYQYKFEYKERKLNRDVEALSGNPVANEQYSEFTDSTDSYDSDDSNKSYKSSSLRNNSEYIKSSTSKPSDIRKVLVITCSGASRAEPSRGEPSYTSQEPSDSTGRITQAKKFIQSKNQSISRSSVESALPLRNKGKPSVPRSIPFNAVRTKPTVFLQPSTSAGAMSKRRERPRKDSAPEYLQAAHKPQSEPKATNLDESCIGKRLLRRRGISEIPVLNENSSSDPSSDDEDSDDSDPIVFRESRSVLPNLKPTLVTKMDNTAPKSGPPRLPGSSLWSAPLQDTYIDVYVDGACSYNRRGEPRTGIGVWFGPNHPLNVSRLSQGRQSNNSAEIEAATVAAQQDHEAGIKKLRIKTDSKFLVKKYFCCVKQLFCNSHLKIWDVFVKNLYAINLLLNMTTIFRHLFFQILCIKVNKNSNFLTVSAFHKTLCPRVFDIVLWILSK